MDFQLEIIDYVLIMIALASSTAIGLYYGFVKKKNDSVDEYFLASRDLSTFKMTCSLFATLFASGAMVGMVAEINYYGLQSAIGSFMFLISQYINMKFFFPIFYKIGSPDLYTYYDLRFSKNIRYFLALLTVIEKTFSNGIIVYGTAIVLSNVSGIHTWTLICIITFICVLYSSLGGVRGVTLADMIQAFIIIASIVTVCVLGFIHIGGFAVFWERNWQSGRLNIFNFDFNPMTRHTFWSSTIGNLFSSLSLICTSQTFALRMMASGSIKDCQRASYYGSLTSVIVFCLCYVIGLLIYAFYYLCDPVDSKMIASPNQLLSLYVGNELSVYTGLAGLFFAGFVCAAVSTLSSCLNGVAAQIMETFVKPLNVVHSERAYTTVAKIAVVVHGGLSMLGIIAIESFPNIYQATMVLLSVTNGPHLALLCIGTFFPQAGLKSSVGAFVSGLVFMLWITTGTLLIDVPDVQFPTSTAGCSLSSSANATMGSFSNWTTTNSTIDKGFFNSTISNVIAASTGSSISWADYFPLSLVSFSWFYALGTLFTLFVFAVLSFVYGAERNRPINFDLIPEPLQTFQKKLSKRWQRFLLCDIYSLDVKAAQEMTFIQSEKLMKNGGTTK